MSNSFTLAFLILGSAILVFFSEEFINAFKKFFSNFIVRLCFFPLLLTTIMLGSMSKTLLVFQWILDTYFLLVEGVCYFLPNYWLLKMLYGGIIVGVLTVLPGWVLEATSLRRDYVSSPYASNVMFFVWIVLIMTIVLS